MGGGLSDAAAQPGEYHGDWLHPLLPRSAHLTDCQHCHQVLISPALTIPLIIKVADPGPSFLGSDPDPLVRCTDPDPETDPDPSIIRQSNNKNLDSYCFVTSL